MDRKWWTLIAVCFGTFMLLLDITVVNVALPDIQQSLHSSFADLQWVVDAYALTLAAFLLTAGVVGDMFGRRGVYADRARHLLVVLAAVRCVDLVAHAQPVASGPGCGRCDHVRDLARADRAGLLGAGAGHGLRCLRRGGRRRRRGRPADRRRDHQRHRLAVDLLRQPADRGRRHR